MVTIRQHKLNDRRTVGREQTYVLVHALHCVHVDRAAKRQSKFNCYLIMMLNCNRRHKCEDSVSEIPNRSNEA